MGQTNEGENPSLILESLQNTKIEDENNTSIEKSFNIIRNILNDYKLYKDILSKNIKNNNNKKTKKKNEIKKEYSKEELMNLKVINYDKNIINDIEHKINRIKKWVKMSKYSDLDKNKPKKPENIIQINDDKKNMDIKNLTKKLNLSNYADLKIEIGILNYYKNKSSKFIKRVKKGPPDCFRWCSWCILNSLPQDRNILIYENYTNMILEKENKDRIIRDIERTFSQQKREKEELRKMETSLYKILKSFWNLDKIIGYCQGMNLIVGFILILSNFNERDSFYLLISMFSNTFKLRKKYDYNIRGLFYDEFPLLNLLNYIFDNLLEHNCSEMKEHLETLGITTDLWMGRWFHTIFTLVLPINWCKRVWDNIFTDNIFFLVKFGICFTKMIQDDILKMEEEEQILNYFKKYEKYSLCFDNEELNQKCDLNKIIEKSQKLDINLEFFLNNYTKDNPEFITKLNEINNIKYEFFKQYVRKPTYATVLFSEENNTKDNLNKFFKDNKSEIINENEIILNKTNSINNQNKKNKNLKNVKNSFSNKNGINNSSDYNSSLKDINAIINNNKENNNINENINKEESNIKETIDNVNEEYEENIQRDLKYDNIIKKNINLHKFENFLNRNKLDIFPQKKALKTFEKNILSILQVKNEKVGLHVPNEDDISTFIGKNKFKASRKINTERKRDNHIIIDKEKIDQWCF